MRIRILGGGWYGCHLAASFLADGHAVELHEIAGHLFAGASGGNPARCHLGFHYPRSRLTRAFCQEHREAFMSRYGFLTAGIPINIYAIAAHDSLMDFGTYRQVLAGEVEFVTVQDPAEYGLQNVEGALLTGERHIVIRRARDYFTGALAAVVRFHTSPGKVDSPDWDMTIDCTFCANDAENIERFEPCLTVLLSGPTDKAVTIMDGPFGSVYPWDEEDELCSLTSARYTPISKTCRTWAEAQAILDAETKTTLRERAEAMQMQLAGFWPDSAVYEVADFRLAIRAMPRSAADARLVDVIRVGERALRVRAGKIDAILHAERVVKQMLGGEYAGNNRDG